MPTPFVMPIPKIGNHPVSCPCGTCDNARKRLAKSPYVQHLQRLVLQFHGEWQQAMGAGLSITQDLHAEGKELAWAEDNLNGFASTSARLAVLLETMTAERDALKTELTGYSTELHAMIAEANTQRKAADDAKDELKALTEKLELLENDLNVVNAANKTLKAANRGLDIEGRRNARLVPALGGIILFTILTWLALKLGVKLGVGGAK